jgi:hypothetical protein
MGRLQRTSTSYGISAEDVANQLYGGTLHGTALCYYVFARARPDLAQVAYQTAVSYSMERLPRIEQRRVITLRVFRDADTTVQLEGCPSAVACYLEALPLARIAILHASLISYRLVLSHENTRHPQRHRRPDSPTDTPALVDGPARTSTAIPCMIEAPPMHARFVPSTRRFHHSLHHVAPNSARPAPSQLPVFIPPKKPPEAFFQHLVHKVHANPL